MIDYVKEHCPKCDCKMIMYYGPYCPECTPRSKIKKNYIQSTNHIQHKYGINTDDYATKGLSILSSVGFNCDHQEAWLDKFAPIPTEYLINPLPRCRFNKKGMDWYDTPTGRDFFITRQDAYRAAPDGAALEIPYQNFHHLFCGVYEFMNGCWITVNWQHVYDRCTYDWQREIASLFVKEFGKRDIKMEFSW